MGNAIEAAKAAEAKLAAIARTRRPTAEETAEAQAAYSAAAKLVDAAPALLDALKGIMSSPMSTKAMLAAHAAIAKAEGK